MIDRRVFLGDRVRLAAPAAVVPNDWHADAPTIAAEFVGTSISSGRDGSDRWQPSEAVAAENPHAKWQNSRRGYVSCTVTENEWRADYRTVAFVSQPGTPITTPASWRVQRGKAGIERV